MTATTSKRPTRKRARVLRPPVRYTSGFTARSGDPAKDRATWGAEFKMNRIPPGFWRSVKAKAKRDRVSIRGLLLTYLQAWLDDNAARLHGHRVQGRTRAEFGK